jgi:broad specificity phosphatase PhoE
MIYLVRHGQTDWVLFRKFNGVTDTFLNQTGIAQSKLQAENLKNVNFDACFCSPKTRARQTCEIIYQGPVVFDDRLAEINAGEFEGTDETDVKAMQRVFQAIMSGDKGTESFQVFMKRVCDFCDMVTQNYEGKNVLIITHGVISRVINYHFKGKPKDYDFMPPVIKTGGLLTFENSST